DARIAAPPTSLGRHIPATRRFGPCRLANPWTLARTLARVAGGGFRICRPVWTRAHDALAYLYFSGRLRRLIRLFGRGCGRSSRWWRFGTRGAGGLRRRRRRWRGPWRGRSRDRRVHLGRPLTRRIRRAGSRRRGRGRSGVCARRLLGFSLLG